MKVQTNAADVVVKVDLSTREGILLDFRRTCRTAIRAGNKAVIDMNRSIGEGMVIAICRMFWHLLDDTTDLSEISEADLRAGVNQKSLAKKARKLVEEDAKANIHGLSGNFGQYAWNVEFERYFPEAFEENADGDCATWEEIREVRSGLIEVAGGNFYPICSVVDDVDMGAVRSLIADVRDQKLDIGDDLRARRDFDCHGKSQPKPEPKPDSTGTETSETDKNLSESGEPETGETTTESVATVALSPKMAVEQFAGNGHKIIAQAVADIDGNNAKTGRATLAHIKTVLSELSDEIHALENPVPQETAQPVVSQELTDPNLLTAGAH